ncbi:MAG TPA: GFA family protein, partial [Burkholderiales bacterium]|nr:GFA family protein [Burkholderiales bacterium]
MIHEGGCLCGALRYRVEGEPARASVCNCTACQRRTGSLAGFGAYFKAEQVRILCGELKSYEHRSDESRRWLR